MEFAELCTLRPNRMEKRKGLCRIILLQGQPGWIKTLSTRGHKQQ